MQLNKIIDNDGCSVPWIHTEINLQYGFVRPCCRYQSKISLVDDFKSVWNGPEYTALRTDIVNNNTHSDCKLCSVPKDVFTYKRWKNASYYQDSRLLDTNTVELPQVFHIFLSNTCNFACRMCNSFASSRIYDMSKKSKFLSDLYNFQPANKLDIRSLTGIFQNAKNITIVGGEPLIDEDCLTLIEMIRQESNNIKMISMPTNMSVINHRLIDSLASLGARIQLNISIDGPPIIHEYIRYGSNWDTMLKNLSYIKSVSKNFQFGVNCTISALNVGYLPELYSSIEEIGLETGIKFSHAMPSPVIDSHLHPGNLPQHIKNIYIDKLKSTRLPNTINNSETILPTALALLNTPIDPTSKIIEFIKEYDRITKTDYKSIYSEFDF